MTHTTSHIDAIKALIAVSTPRQARVLCQRYDLPLPDRHREWLAENTGNRSNRETADERHEREQSAWLRAQQL